MPLHHTTIGILINKPRITSKKLPCAAPATPSTLSMPMTASAITIVFIAPISVVEA